MLIQPPISQVEECVFPVIPDRLASFALALQYQLEWSQWLDPQALLELQMQQLRGVLLHALQAVPYYRSTFEKTGLCSIPENISMEFLHQLPVLSRTDVQTAGKNLYSTSIPAKHGQIYKLETSGSSGTPVRVLGTRLTQVLWRVFAIRELAWNKTDFSLKLCVIRRAKKQTGAPPHGTISKGWGPILDKSFKPGVTCFLNIASPLEQQVQWLLKNKPDYLLSFPSNLAAISSYCIDNNIDFDGLRQLKTIGETLTPQHRMLFKKAWNVKAADMYSCEEAGYLAIQCPENEHYHVQSENIILEIVDDNNQPCQPGQIGRVLITTLHNYATPLIRYELDDMAEWGESCNCGRQLPVIKRIHGRKRNRLIMPDGRSEFPYLGEDDEFEQLTGLILKQFQFIQKSTEDIEFKLVLERPLTTDEEHRVTKQLQSNLGHPFNIVFSYPEFISKKASGKFEEFVCEIDL